MQQNWREPWGAERQGTKGFMTQFFLFLSTQFLSFIVVYYWVTTYQYPNFRGRYKQLPNLLKFSSAYLNSWKTYKFVMLLEGALSADVACRMW